MVARRKFCGSRAGEGQINEYEWKQAEGDLGTKSLIFPGIRGMDVKGPVQLRATERLLNDGT